MHSDDRRRSEATMFKLAEPDRIVLDIPGAELDATLATVVNEAKEGTVPLTEPHDIVAKIRYSLFSKEPSTVRIVIDLQKKSELILSDVLPGGLISAKFAKGKDRYRVVIDPGHGGKDSGAVSVTNRFEKDLVLSLGHKVADLLQKEPGIEAVMTRTDDTFIELADRVPKRKSPRPIYSYRFTPIRLTRNPSEERKRSTGRRKAWILRI